MVCGELLIRGMQKAGCHTPNQHTAEVSHEGVRRGTSQWVAVWRALHGEHTAQSMPRVRLLTGGVRSTDVAGRHG